MKLVPIKEVAPAAPANITWHPDEDVWLLNLDQIESQSGQILNEIRGPASDAGSSTHHFDTGNVLYSKLRPYLNKVVLPQEPGIATSELVPLRPDPKQLSREYLTSYLRSPGFVTWVSNEVAGAKMPRVSMKTFWKHQIPLPPLAEQKRIAAILDAADALRAKRRESLEQLDTLLQSIFLEMFGDPVTNPMEWGVAHLPDFVSKRKHSLKRGPFGGALKKEIFTSEGFKVYQQKNVIYDDFYTGSNYIGDSDFERLAAFMVRPRDLLISCSGTIGRIAAVPLDAEPGVMNQALLKLELDESKILNDFFLSLWRSRPFEQRVLGMTHGTGMKNMKSMKELKSIKFLQPPLDLQHRFATIVESIEQQKAAHRSHLEEIDTLFASLQQRAFQGEL